MFKPEPQYPDVYLVAFLDLLGQGARLLAADRAILDASSISVEAVTRMGESMRPMVAFRAQFTELCDKVLSAGIDRHVPKVVSLGDSIVIIASLGDGPPGVPQLRALFRVLHVIAGGFMNMAHAECLFRGGIDIGTGVYFGSSDFYGAGLVKAYRLESHIAMYPRVVVGNDLFAYLRSANKVAEGTKSQLELRNYITMISALITHDQLDNIHILDWLGSGMKQMFGSAVDVTKLDQLRAHITASFGSTLTSNSRLATAHSRLLGYVDSRISLWRE